jgi:uncharacterized membrane protein YozB (DUF420 family)
MSIFDVPAINATLNGLSTSPIWGGRLDLDSARSRAVALNLSDRDTCPAFPIDRRRKMGKFILPILLYVTVTGVYFMLYQCFPSTHFDELKKRHEVKIEAANH